MSSIVSPPPVYIYALIDPRDNQIRYIGKSRRPLFRLREHLRRLYEPCHKAHWLDELTNLGLQPRLLVLDTVTGAECDEKERAYIAHYRARGCPLTNHADGGPGAPGYKHTPDGRAKMQAAHARLKGTPAYQERFAHLRRPRVVSAETRAKLSLALRGRPHSPEHTAKVTAAITGRTGRPRTLEEKAHLSLIGKGRKLGPMAEETKAKLSAALKGRPSANKGKPMSETTRAKLSASKKGRPQSLEHRAKQSAALRNYWARQRAAGQVRHMSEATRATLSAAKKGRPAHNKGQSQSTETRAKLSAAMKGRPSWAKGKPSPLRGRTLGAETRANQSAGMRASWARRRDVQQDVQQDVQLALPLGVIR